MKLQTVFCLIPLGGCAMGGAMRQATLVGQCGAEDVACSRRNPQAPLAIGTRFHPDVVAVEDGALVARKQGASAVLISTDDGSVVDFVHVWVAPVTKITLARRDGDRIGNAVGLAVGEDITIQPTLWNGAQRLSGDGDAVWTVSNGSAVSVLRDGSSDRRRLRARAPGKATVTVAQGESKTSVEIEVIP